VEKYVGTKVFHTTDESTKLCHSGMNEQGCHTLNKGSNYSALLDPFKDSGKLCPDGRF